MKPTSPASRAKSAAERAARAAADHLRSRPGWQLHSPSLRRTWKLRLGSKRYEVEAHAMVFDGRSWFLSVTVHAARSRRSIRAELLSSTWCRDVGRRLGAGYVLETRDPPGWVRWVRPARDLVRAPRVLRELDAVTAAVEGRVASRAARPVGRRDATWAVLDACRSGPWHVSSIGHAFERRVAGWTVAVRLSTIVDSAVGRPGVSTLVHAMPPRRATGEGPLARLDSQLRSMGYGEVDEHMWMRWRLGIDLRAVKREVDLLERVGGDSSATSR